MTTITATTPLGTFTRRTDNAYTHIIVDADTKTALRWSGNANASEAKNAKVVADGIRYFQKTRTTKVVAFPIGTAAVPDAHDSGQHAKANPFCMKCSADKAAQAERSSETTVPLGTPESHEARIDRLNSRRAAQARAAATEAAPVASQEQLDQLQAAHEQAGVLTRAEARALVGTDTILRQVGKSLAHAIKADRKDDTLARTLCGVPINGAAQNWLALGVGLTNCPTCNQAARKAA